MSQIEEEIKQTILADLSTVAPAMIDPVLSLSDISITGDATRLAVGVQCRAENGSPSILKGGVYIFLRLQNGRWCIEGKVLTGDDPSKDNMYYGEILTFSDNDSILRITPPSVCAPEKFFRPNMAQRLDMLFVRQAPAKFGLSSKWLEVTGDPTSKHLEFQSPSQPSPMKMFVKTTQTKEEVLAFARSFNLSLVYDEANKFVFIQNKEDTNPYPQQGYPQYPTQMYRPPFQGFGYAHNDNPPQQDYTLIIEIVEQPIAAS